MGRVQETIVAALAADLADRVEWDEPPQLFWMSLSAGAATLRQFPAEAAFFDGENPADILSAAAQLWTREREKLQHAAPAGLHGLAFFCETWAVDYTPDMAEEIESEARQRRLDLHPDRVERRDLHAVDRAGIRYQAVQPREGEITTRICYPNRSDELTGTIFDALDEMLTALLGVELPR